MHRRAELNGLLVSLDSLTLGKQKQWLDSQPEPKTKAETTELLSDKATNQTQQG